MGVRDRFGSLARAFLLLVAAATPPAHAQLVCSLGVTGGGGYNAFLDAAPTPRALGEMEQVYNLLCPQGCGQISLVSNPTAGNARAETSGNGVTKVAYSAAFMNEVASTFGGGATFGILAHEFGHHIDFHSSPPWMNNSYSRELKADAWAGCALANAGVGTGQIEAALRAIAAFPSPSHPGWPQRSQAVRTGFVNCGGSWRPGYDRLAGMGVPGGGMPAPIPVPLSQVCATQFGQCLLPAPNPVGSQCSCSGYDMRGMPYVHPGFVRP